MTKQNCLLPVHLLGRGIYGSVTLRMDSESGVYARKTCPLKFFSNLLKELHIMDIFDKHPCIVRAMSHLVHIDEPVCYINMEYANKGTLEKMISEEFGGKPLPVYMIQRATRMILQGLEALHAKGYVHCDIKPANLLLFTSTTHGEPFDLKLADFGLSKQPNSDSTSGSLGTPLYMPPESFCSYAPIEPACDIWSLGSVVHEMFGCKPQKQILEGGYYDWIRNEGISPVAIDFLCRCHNHISRRATASELLKHPFITHKLTPDALLPTRIDQMDWNMLTPMLPASFS